MWKKLCFKHALFLTCEKKCICLSNLKLCSLFLLHLILCFCSWQSLLCYRYDILYKQICDLHSPLPIDLNCSPRIFNLQNLGRQQSNCSKTRPQKIKAPPSQLDVQMFFSHFFTFFPSAFSKRIFSLFPSACSKCFFFFHISSHDCEKCERTCEKNVFWKCAWRKMWKTCVLNMWKNVNNMGNMWKMVTEGSWKVPVS